MRINRTVGLLLATVATVTATLAASQPAQAEDPIVKLVSQQNGKCLQPATLDQGASVIQMTCNGTTPQQWFISSVNSTRVHLRSKAAPTLCADAFGKAANGTPVIMWPCNSISNENWGFGITNNLLVSAVSNTFSHCMATPGSNDGLPIELRFCDGNLSQLWSRPNG